VRSRASYFVCEYPLLSLRSFSSFLSLLHRLPVASIPPFIFPTITCCRRQFLRKMCLNQLAFLLLISCRIFLCALTLSNTSLVTEIHLLPVEFHPLYHDIFKVRVAQLVETLCYKLEGRGFDSRWCQWNFSLSKSFRSHSGLDVTSNRNEYQAYFLGGKGGRYVGLTTLPPSYDGCLKIWETQPPGTLRACQGL
jgi:hypothetical protein